MRKEAAGIRLYGLAAALAADGPARGPQHLFVNRRAVKDRTILHAVNDAYSRATIKPRSPEVHLFLELPHERVDVNVHPTKAEVRFVEQGLVHEVVWRGLTDALGQEAAPEVSLSPPPGASPPEPRTHAIPGIVAGMGAASRWGAVTEVFRRRDDEAARAGSLRGSAGRAGGRPGLERPPRCARLHRPGARLAGERGGRRSRPGRSVRRARRRPWSVRRR